MSTTLNTRIFKKVYEDNLSLNINPSTTRLESVGLAQSTALSSSENLSLISPSPSHEQDLVSAAVSPRMIFEQLVISKHAAATSNTPTSVDQRLDALTSDFSLTKKRLESRIEKLEGGLTTVNLDLAAINLRIGKQAADLAAVNLRIGKQEADLAAADVQRGDLKAVVEIIKDDIQKLKARIRPLACIALRVFLDAMLAVKGYNTDTCGSQKVWISEHMEHLLLNTGISESRFEFLLNSYRDVADTNARITESLEVALAIEVMGEGRLEFSQLFEECLGHSIDAQIHGCIRSTCIDGRNENRAGHKVVQFITTRPHAKSRACKVANCYAQWT